jgi:hypothetical protein
MFKACLRVVSLSRKTASRSVIPWCQKNYHRTEGQQWHTQHENREGHRQPRYGTILLASSFSAAVAGMGVSFLGLSDEKDEEKQESQPSYASRKEMSSVRTLCLDVYTNY